MVPATLLGMALAVGSLLAMMVLEGSSPMAVVLLPPLILVFGGTFGAAIAGSNMADVRRIGSWFRLAFAPEKASRNAKLVALLVELATHARKEGMLPLEQRARNVEDPFLRRGLQMAIDGVPVEQLRAVLENEITVQRIDDRVAAKFFARMGGYAPTIGIIGTVVGLVQVLQSLEDPELLGPLVATAFVATLWGVLSANFIWLPMSVKIQRNSDLRAAEMQVLVAGITEILAGTNPRALRVRLQSMLPPGRRPAATARRAPDAPNLHVASASCGSLADRSRLTCGCTSRVVRVAGNAGADRTQETLDMSTVQTTAGPRSSSAAPPARSSVPSPSSARPRPSPAWAPTETSPTARRR